MSPTALEPTDGSPQHRADALVEEPAAPSSGGVDLEVARRALRVALPEPGSRYDQDDEWCVVQRTDGTWQEFRFHDYDRIFEVPGLYEKIFYDVLGCDSPRFMVGLLGEALAGADVRPDDLRVLDLGAGNGIMAEELAAEGVTHSVGVDILPEARTAAERDRPGLYAGYHVADLTALPAAEHAALAEHRLNALTVVAALGFGDIPPAALRTAYDLVDDGGWIVLDAQGRVPRRERHLRVRRPDPCLDRVGRARGRARGALPAPTRHRRDAAGVRRHRGAQTGAARRLIDPVEGSPGKRAVTTRRQGPPGT